MKKIIGNQYVRLSLILLFGIFLGWIFFHSSPVKVETHDHEAEIAKAQIWTCAMHPQIRMDKPGKCPICAMDLIPVVQNGGATVDPSSIHLTKEASQLANVLTTVVSRQSPVKELRLYGKVQADERLLQNQVSHISGRIDKLQVNFTGEPVSKGQKLAVIYSPELVTAQQELLEAARTKQSQPEIYEAAIEKLRQWKLTEAQISDIERSGNVKANVDIVSTTNGIVTTRRVNNGDYVNPGSVLYEISDLSRVWVLFDAYESDLPFLKQGDKIDFAIQALPGSSFSGIVKFIDPVIDPTNRVAKVRVEINNQGGKLKPEMFATGIVKSNLDEYRDKLVIPRSAVLWTGKRSIVYVKQPGDEPVFKIREIGLGPQLGDSYVVTDGLTDGEEIVTQGAFNVDAAAQLEDKPSMMNPSGGEKATSMPGMVMPGDANSGENNSTPVNTKPIDSIDMSGMDMSSDTKTQNSKSMTDMGSDSKQKTDRQLINVKNSKKNQNQRTKLSSEMLMQQQLKVAGNCDLCKERIETAAKSVAGVKSANWNVEKQMLNISFDESKTSIDDISKVIAAVGHDTEKIKANDATYNELPGCCRYRK